MIYTTPYCSFNVFSIIICCNNNTDQISDEILPNESITDEVVNTNDDNDEILEMTNQTDDKQEIFSKNTVNLNSDNVTSEEDEKIQEDFSEGSSYSANLPERNNETSVRRLSLFDSLKSDSSEETVLENTSNHKSEPILNSDSEIQDNSNLSEENEIKDNSENEFNPEENELSDLNDEFNQETEEELLDIPTFLRRQAN